MSTDAPDPSIASPGAPEAEGDPPQADIDPNSTEPTNSVAPEPQMESVNELTPQTRLDRAYRSTDAQRLTVLAAIEAGKSPREASIEAGVSIRTTFRILSQAESQQEEIKEAFRKLLQAKALARLEDWETASQVGARKRGNHGPARDWLLHAGALDPLDSDKTNVQVAIVIGTDDRPMRVRSPLSYAPATDAEE